MKIAMYVLIPVVAMSMDFNLIDSASVANNMKKVKHLRQRAENITQQVDQSVMDRFKGKKPVEMRAPSPPASAPVLVHPDELFKNPPVKKIISYKYIDDGKYLTKKDFNKIIDSLVLEFKFAFDMSNERSEELQKIISELTDQSQKHNNRWQDIIDLIKSGSLAALITAIGGLLAAAGWIFKRRKKNVPI